MVKDLKGWELFEGFRGAPPIDTLKIVSLLADILQWVAVATWLGKLDINPLIASSETLEIVDVRMRICNEGTKL